MDGIDAGIFDLSDKMKLVASLTYPIPKSTTDQLWEIVKNDDIDDPQIKQLNHDLGNLFAEAAVKVIEQAELKTSDIKAIGSHGQNISHHPNDPKPYSLQIADPEIIRAQTGITTVANFRAADIAAGGQGAPLSPLLHNIVAKKAGINRVMVNIGGIANVSFLGDQQQTIGFDTGPGNGLMDSWIKKHKQLDYDRNGEWAASGTVNKELLASMLADDYFQKPAPKSTGKEYFNLSWLEKFTVDHTPQNIQATLCELTAQSIINAIKNHWHDCEIIICGGGVHNKFLMQRLNHLSKNKVMPSNEIGIDPDYLEAQLFAWLAQQRINNIKLDTTAITGAKQPVLLGDVF